MKPSLLVIVGAVAYLCSGCGATDQAVANAVTAATATSAAVTATPAASATPATPTAVTVVPVPEAQKPAPSVAAAPATTAAVAVATPEKIWGGDPTLGDDFTWGLATSTGLPPGYHLANQAEATTAVKAGAIARATEPANSETLAWTSSDIDATTAYAVDLRSGESVATDKSTVLHAIFVR